MTSHLATQSGTANPLLAFTVSATGPYTVVFHLQSRYSPFLQTLLTYIESPTQLQKLGSLGNATGNFGSDPICVGPFMYDSQIPGVSITVIKSPYYYEKYSVYLDKIVFLDETSTAVAAADLEAGDIQAVNNLNAGDLPGIQADKSLSLVQGPVNGDTDVIINLRPGSGNPLQQSPKLLEAFEDGDRPQRSRQGARAGRHTGLHLHLAPVALLRPGAQVHPLRPGRGKETRRRIRHTQSDHPLDCGQPDPAAPDLPVHPIRGAGRRHQRGPRRRAQRTGLGRFQLRELRGARYLRLQLRQRPRPRDDGLSPGG